MHQTATHTGFAFLDQSIPLQALVDYLPLLPNAGLRSSWVPKKPMDGPEAIIGSKKCYPSYVGELPEVGIFATHGILAS